MGGITTTIAVEEDSSTMARVVHVHAMIEQAVVHRSIHPRQALDIKDEIPTSRQHPRGSHHLPVLQASGLACRRRRRLLPMCRVGVITVTATDKTMPKATDITNTGRHHRQRRLAWIQDSNITAGHLVRMDTIRGRLAVTEVEGIKAPETIGRKTLSMESPYLIFAGVAHRVRLMIK
jgi:hypothetical protein